MERKIGEIFEYNGEWYQCVGGTCRNCSFYYNTVCKNITTIGSTNFGNCHCSLRTDHKSVIFKKLEKVGEPYTTFVNKTVQNYLLETAVSVPPKDVFTLINNEQRLIAIEIKQNKEDMEEQHSTENYPTKEEKIAERIANKVSEDIQNQLEKNMNKLKLKPFSLEAAKAGKPVCTRDGRKARIICFDRKSHSPIIALVETFVKEYNSIREDAYYYTIDGRAINIENESKDDLMMLPEKKEGWVNVYKDSVYDTKSEALICRSGHGYIDTIKVSWEE